MEALDYLKVPIPEGDRCLSKGELSEKYQKIAFECKKHGAFEAVVLGISMEKNIIFTSKCPLCQYHRAEALEKMREEDERERKAQERAIFKQTMIGCGVSLEFFDEREKFNDTIGILPRLTHCQTKQGVKNFLEVSEQDFRHKDNILLFGVCGIGKSVFGYRLIEIAHALGKTYKMIKVTQLIKKAKNYNFDLAYFLEDVDCIIIDEIDDGFGDLIAFNELVSYTRENNIRLIVIGNCSIEGFLNAVVPKVRSRLSGAVAIQADANMDDLRKK